MSNCSLSLYTGETRHLWLFKPLTFQIGSGVEDEEDDDDDDDEKDSDDDENEEEESDEEEEQDGEELTDDGEKQRFYILTYFL